MQQKSWIGKIPLQKYWDKNFAIKTFGRWRAGDEIGKLPLYVNMAATSNTYPELRVAFDKFEPQIIYQSIYVTTVPVS